MPKSATGSISRNGRCNTCDWDKGIIPYTSIGGTLLYPESKIDEVLERNYYKPRVFGR